MGSDCPRGVTQVFLVGVGWRRAGRSRWDVFCRQTGAVPALLCHSSPCTGFPSAPWLGPVPLASTQTCWAGTARVTQGFEGCRNQVGHSPSHEESATSARALHPLLTFICHFIKFTNSAGPSQQSKSGSFVPRICFDNYSEANWYICRSNFIQLLN